MYQYQALPSRTRNFHQVPGSGDFSRCPTVLLGRHEVKKLIEPVPVSSRLSSVLIHARAHTAHCFTPYAATSPPGPYTPYRRHTRARAHTLCARWRRALRPHGRGRHTARNTTSGKTIGVGASVAKEIAYFCGSPT
eukprot:scaffold10178_cov129-Isochrysis_galbana.AAC.8